DFSVITDCIAAQNGGSGFQLGSRSIMKDSIAVSNQGQGGIFFQGEGGVVHGNVVANNDGPGMVLGAYSTLIGNVAVENSDAGINPGGSSVVFGNASSANLTGLEASDSGYAVNVFNDNATDVGNGNKEIGQNLCGGDTTCP